jgi:uncharacterized membrane protein YesL
MAGLFGFFDFTKEGPGVPENHPPKARILVFFEVLSRKFWNIVKINFLFFLLNLPAIILTLFLSAHVVQLVIPQEELTGFINADGVLLGAFPVLLCLVCIPAITVGPAQAGMTYILRNYSREEHAFLFSDFFETAKKNMKQSLIVSTINTVISLILVHDICLYSRMSAQSSLMSLATVLLAFALILFFMMNMYIYPMMVTFKLTVRQIYKNALLFSLIRFFPNLAVLTVCFAIVIIPFLIQPFIAFPVFIFITMGLISFITNFYTYAIIEKYMMKDDMTDKSEAI